MYKAWLNFGAFSGLSPETNSGVFCRVVRSHDSDPEETLLYSKVTVRYIMITCIPPEDTKFSV
jgi:hypothetical protein